MNEDGKPIDGQQVYCSIGGGEWFKLETVGEIRTPSLPKDEQKWQVPKPISVSCTLKTRNVSPLIRQLLGMKVKHRLPRKIKKAAKGLYSISPDGSIHTKRYTMTYGWKKDTKWKRKAYGMLCRPILKIPKKPLAEAVIKPMCGHVFPVVQDPTKTIILGGEK